uniref:Putative proline and glutamine-rich splicing factor sfpq n=1 Tax=Rhipicephalus pulchellus TaxID=72859 RepID=L7M9V8_RHIPC
MSGRRGSSSYPPRHSPYGGGGNRGYGGGGRQYDERNSHYGQHDGSRSPHSQSQPDNRYQSKSMPPPQQQPRSSSQPSKPSPQPQQQQQQQQQSPRQTQQQQQSPQQTPRPQQAPAQVNNSQQQKTPVQQQKPSPVQQQKKDQAPNQQATPPKPVAKVEPPSPVANQNSQPATNASSGQGTPNATTPNSANATNTASKPGGEHAENCKLFVSNVSNMMNDETFRKMFEEHGEVRDIFLNKTKWFGFVLFKTHEQAEKALRALNGTEKNGRRLNVRYATQQKPDQGGQQGGPPGVPGPQQMQQQQQQGPFGGPPGQGPPMPPPHPQPVKRSGARCRLFVGNLGNNMTEEEFRRIFGAYGELLEVFLHAQKGFGFIKYEQRHQAEAAKAALDNTPHDGRYLQVRFATQGSSLKVKNLSPFVSNELLEDAFSIFGEIDRAVVIVDDRGRSVGEGIVEFARKTSAMAALKKASQSCLLLTASPRPVLVEPLDLRDEEDGFPEKNINKNNPQYLKEREIGPRFAEPGTFEYEFSSRWKKLLELEKQKREFLDREMEDERRKLEEEMEYYRYEHETRLLREQLRIMEEQSKIFQHEREMRHAEQKRREEMRRQEEMLLRQREEDILGFTRREQAAQQAASMQQMAPPQQPLDPMAAAAAAQTKAPTAAIEGATFVSSYDSGTRVSRFDQQQPPQQHYGMQADDGRRPDDYADRDPKRRRY